MDWLTVLTYAAPLLLLLLVFHKFLTTKRYYDRMYSSEHLRELADGPRLGVALRTLENLEGVDALTDVIGHGVGECLGLVRAHFVATLGLNASAVARADPRDYRIPTNPS